MKNKCSKSAHPAGMVRFIKVDIHGHRAGAAAAAVGVPAEALERPPMLQTVHAVA